MIPTPSRESARATSVSRCFFGVVDRAEIHVKLPWNAKSLHIRLEHSQNILTVLGGGKAHEDPSRGIVDRHEQATHGSAVLEPCVGTAIKLHQCADGVPPFASLAVLPCCTDPDPRARPFEPSPECIRVDDQVMMLGKHLGKQCGPIIG